MPSSHIGHNKFQVLDKDGPQAVLFGSTNWTSNAFCAQTNNSIIARSPALAAAYKDYWEHASMRTPHPPGEGGKAQQSSAFRDENAKAPYNHIGGRQRHGRSMVLAEHRESAREKPWQERTDVPPDLTEVFDLIAKAQHAILFLAFQPGTPSIVDAVAEALKAKPSLFVRGAVTASQAAGASLHRNSWRRAPRASRRSTKRRSAAARGLPRDPCAGSTAERRPRSVGSRTEPGRPRDHPRQDRGHRSVLGQLRRCDRQPQLGYTASYNNDENMAIIREPSCDRRGIRGALPRRLRPLCLALLAEHRQRTRPGISWPPTAAWQDGYFS